MSSTYLMFCGAREFQLGWVVLLTMMVFTSIVGQVALLPAEHWLSVQLTLQDFLMQPMLLLLEIWWLVIPHLMMIIVLPFLPLIVPLTKAISAASLSM